MKKNDFSSNQPIDGDKKDKSLDMGENLSEPIYPKSKQPLDKKEISLKNNQFSEEKKDVNSIKHPLDSKSISIEVKDHHDEKIAQIQTVKKMDKMMSLGAKQQIIAKKTFPKIPKLSSSFILASNVNSPIFSTLQTLVNQNENQSNIDLLRKILKQIQNMETAQKEQEKKIEKILILMENFDKRLLKLEQKFDKLIGGMQKTLNEIQE